MFSRLHSRLTYANIVSTLALFLVLSGGSAMALSGSNTVFSDDIKDGEVKNPDIAAKSIGGGKVGDNSLGPIKVVPDSLASGQLAPNAVGASELAGDAVSGPKVANNSLTGDDLDEASLGKVGDADKLDGKDSAAFWTGKSYRLTSEETDGGADGTGTAQSVFCDIGDSATGGGYAGLSPSEGTVTRTVPTDLFPIGGKQEGWTVEWENDGTTTNRNVVVHARCADVAPFHP